MILCVDLIYILECSSIDTPRLLVIYNMLFNVNIKRLGVLKLSFNRLERTPPPYIPILYITNLYDRKNDCLSYVYRLYTGCPIYTS